MKLPDWVGPASRSPAVILTAASSLVVMVTMGARMSLGLFVSPLNSRTGLGLAAISLALAVGQFTWGAVQPLAGALAYRYGPRPVLNAGLILLAAGCLLTPLATTEAALILTLGLLLPLGAGASSFSVLFGAIAARLAPAQRGTASGFINTGSSLGQFVFAPVVQALIGAAGSTVALCSLGLVSLATLPLARLFGSGSQQPPASSTAPVKEAASQPRTHGLGTMIARAMRDPSYQLLHAGFFTCGFHIAFLSTHLPGEVQLCGLSTAVAGWAIAVIGLGNIAGSVSAGFALRHFRGKSLLFWIYALRAAMVVGYLFSSRSAGVLLAFSAGLGLTWLATVPPTAGLVGKLFDTRYLSTLFGLVLVSHQIGGFFGAWLGGLAVSRWGSYDAMFWADAGLAGAAALLCLPIRERQLAADPQTA